MKVLLITGSFPPDTCGVGDYTASLARNLSEIQGNEVHVLTTIPTSSPTEAIHGQVEVHRDIRKWGLASTRRLVSTLRAVKPDITHIQYPSLNYPGFFLPWLTPLICRCLGSRVVQTWHEGFGLHRVFMWGLLVITPGPIVVVRPNYVDTLHPLLRWVRYLKEIVYVESASSIPTVELSEMDAQRIRSRYPIDRKLLVFFGFLYPQKGISRIFEFADPNLHHIVIAGAAPGNGSYLHELQERANEADWCRKVSFEGQLPALKVAELLSVADAVVLPFELGGGEWNSSIQAAKANRTFVLTTSYSKKGYDSKTDTYYTKPGDVVEMREALAKRLSLRLLPDRTPAAAEDSWKRIARQHQQIYMNCTEQSK